MSKTHGLRQFLDDVAKLGYTFDGYDGNSHPRLRHTSGFTISVSRTPSDYRSRRNEIARLERLAGRKLPRANAPHYRRQRAAVSNFTPSASERNTINHIDKLCVRADELRDQWGALVEQIARAADRDSANTARKILAAYEDIRNQLADYHRHIPPISGGAA